MTDQISKQEHERLMNNTILFLRIDSAIADAKFEAEKMGKDKERFIDPLVIAGQICRDMLIGLPQAPPEKPPEAPQDS